MTCLYIQRKSAQALNRIHKKEAIVIAANIAQRIQIHAISAQVIYKADRKQPRPGNCRCYGVQRVVNRKPGYLNSALLQAKPRIVIGGKFFAKCNHAVTLTPVDSERDKRDSL